MKVKIMFNIPSISMLSMIIIGLFGIGFLITIHEFGHFILCQIFNIPTPRFAVGVGPTIFKKQFKRTLFSIGIIPVAGYVQIGNDDDSENNILNKYPLWKSFFVIFGGIIFNILFAYITIIALSLSENQNSIINKFNPQPSLIINNPSEENHNKEIVRIISCNEKQVSSIADVLLYATLSGDTTNLLAYKSENPDNQYNIHIATNDLIKNNTYTLSSENSTQKKSIMGKIMHGIIVTNNIIKHTINSFTVVFSKKNYKKMSGIIGIIKGLADAVNTGFSLFISFLAIISINLAIMNVLPLPILDGGQFMLILIKKIFPKVAFSLIEQILFYGSLLVIGSLMLFTTYYDIVRCFFN